MAMCKFCGVPFAWGSADGKWVPLVPIGQDDGLDRQYQNEDGILRASHRSVCVNQGGPTVRVALLAKKVLAEDVLPTRKTEKSWAVEAGLGLGPSFEKKPRKSRQKKAEAT